MIGTGGGYDWRPYFGNLKPKLMARDETGMNVVLIDVAGNLARIHRVYPGLAKRFEYVGKMGPEEVAYVAPEGDDRPVRCAAPEGRRAGCAQEGPEPERRTSC